MSNEYKIIILKYIIYEQMSKKGVKIKNKLIILI